MHVFTDEWVQQVRSRYEKQPHHQRPIAYHVAIDDEYEAMRAEIEKQIADLPQVSRDSHDPQATIIQESYTNVQRTSGCRYAQTARLSSGV